MYSKPTLSPRSLQGQRCRQTPFSDQNTMISKQGHRQGKLLLARKILIYPVLHILDDTSVYQYRSSYQLIFILFGRICLFRTDEHIQGRIYEVFTVPARFYVSIQEVPKRLLVITNQLYSGTANCQEPRGTPQNLKVRFHWKLGLPYDKIMCPNMKSYVRQCKLNKV